GIGTRPRGTSEAARSSACAAATWLRTDWPIPPLRSVVPMPTMPKVRSRFLLRAGPDGLGILRQSVVDHEPWDFVLDPNVRGWLEVDRIAQAREREVYLFGPRNVLVGDAGAALRAMSAR